MRHHRDPRRTRSEIQLLEYEEIVLDGNGDPIESQTDPNIVWEGRALIEPWLPRYNIPTAPITGGVAERRVAARTYLPPDAPVQDGQRVYDVSRNLHYSIVSSALEMAGTGNVWRLDLGAPRVLDNV